MCRDHPAGFETACSWRLTATTTITTQFQVYYLHFGPSDQ